MPLIIEFEDCLAGNKAVAAVLLLYYHLAREGGFTNDQTVYLAETDFDPFLYLNVIVAEDLKNEIDETLLREGSVIYLLCELNDLVAEYEGDFMWQPSVRQILGALANAWQVIPEVASIVQEVSLGESRLNFTSLGVKLQSVYENYVVRSFQDLSGKRPHPGWAMRNQH